MDIPTLLIIVSVYVLLLLVFSRLRELMKPPRSRMIIYKDLCNGCGNCVVICPVNALRSEVKGGKGPENWEVVMKIENGTAIEFNMNLCERVTKPKEEACRLCIDSCPLNAIDFTY